MSNNISKVLFIYSKGTITDRTNLYFEATIAHSYISGNRCFDYQCVSDFAVVLELGDQFVRNCSLQQHQLQQQPQKR